MSSSATSKDAPPPRVTPTEGKFLAGLSGVVTRGVLAGVAGATALALWFLIVDGSQGQPLRTPLFLANALLGGDRAQMGFAGIILYTLIHYGAFVVMGLAMSWILSLVETSSPVLLGLVMGFALFDLVFYGSVIVTGVDVVQALGWPEVLAGNLIAGVTVLGTLHLAGATRPVTYLEAIAEHQVVREAVVAGLIGATIVAAWFLVFDLARGQPFFTPAALGSTLFLGANSVDDVSISALTVGGYTVLHVAAFILTGFIAAAIAVAAEEQPPLILGAVLFFAVFEAFFMGALAMLAQFLLGALALWSIAVGNLLAAVSMGVYLWIHHPRLREALRTDPLDQTD
jgi:hypothetical protein